MQDSPVPPSDELPKTHTSLVRLAALYESKHRDPACERAINEVLTLYRKPLERCARRSGLSDNDAEEVVQLLLIRVCRNHLLARWKPDEARLGKFLLVALRTEVWHFLRARAARPDAGADSLDAEAGPGGLALKDLVPHPEAFESSEEYDVSCFAGLLSAAADAVAARLTDLSWVFVLRQYVTKIEGRKSSKDLVADLNRALPRKERLDRVTFRKRASRLRKELLAELEALIAREGEEGKIPGGEADRLLDKLEDWIDKGGTLGDE